MKPRSRINISGHDLTQTFPICKYKTFDITEKTSVIQRLSPVALANICIRGALLIFFFLKKE